MKKILTSFILLLIIAIGLPVISIIKAQDTIRSENQLVGAISNGGGNEITIGGDIDINRPIEVEGKTVVINLNNHTLKLGDGFNGENMFELSNGANVTIKGGTLDGNSGTLNGNNRGRLFRLDNSTIDIDNATVENGTTEEFKVIYDNTGKIIQQYQGGAIFASHSTINLTNVTVRNNHTKNNTPGQIEGIQNHVIAPHGGAIYLGHSNLNIVGGSFENNHSGGGNPHGEGGAIKAEGGSHININNAPS